MNGHDGNRQAARRKQTEKHSPEVRGRVVATSKLIDHKRHNLRAQLLDVVEGLGVITSVGKCRNRRAAEGRQFSMSRSPSSLKVVDEAGEVFGNVPADCRDRVKAVALTKGLSNGQSSHDDIGTEKRYLLKSRVLSSRS